MLVRTRPDLAAELYNPQPYDFRGEQAPGKKGWYTVPVFTRWGDRLFIRLIAAYIVLIAAHARGLGGYWRTPEVLRTDAGREAVGLEPNERFVALIHLGRPVQEKPAPEREPVASVAEYLD